MAYVEIEEYDEDELLSPLDYVDEDFLSEPSYGPGNGAGEGRSMEFIEMMEYCVLPTSMDAGAHVGKVLFWTLLFRFLSQNGKVPSWMFHGLSSLSGVFVLSHFFHTNIVYMMGLLLISYVSLAVTHRWIRTHRGPVLMGVCILFNAICELTIALAMDWHQIRGAQMILSMKIISLGFDMDSAHLETQSSSPSESDMNKEETQESFPKKGDRLKRRRNERVSSAPKAKPSLPPVDLRTMPAFMQMSGYCLNPGNSVFGPWTKYEDYLNLHREPVWNWSWLLKIIFSIICAFVFLSISTCWNAWMIKDGSWKWLLAYRDAMSFRASHYFVSFVSEATSVAAGYGYSKVEQSWNDLTVTRPNGIEMPRSLVEVVVSWNIPMHKWLKTYCFKTARPYGTLAAVGSTYIASAFLHGLNFQLAAVLLSLGAYTYVEFGFRRKLARIFDASIEARSDSQVTHKHSEKEALVILVNVLFGVLAYFHLAYLGVMFGHSSPAEAEGYSWRHTLSKWRNLGFLSHYVVAFTYSISFLL